SVLVGLWSPVVALPVNKVSWGVAVHALPPDVAVVGECHVGEQGVAWFHGLHRDWVGCVVGAWSNSEETVFWVNCVEAVLAQLQPSDVVANNLSGPAWDGWGDHGEVGLATSRWECCCDVVRLALWVDQLQDEHVLSHPAFFASHDRCDTQCVALLCQDCVSAVAGTVGPNFLGLWELGDVLGVVARPCNVFLAWLQRSTNGVEAPDEAAVRADLVQRFNTHAGHDAHGHDNVLGVSELHTKLRVRIADWTHAERHDVHGAPLHGTSVMLGH